ncbi:MAG: OmpA family protein [Deltaproteobacteria bacterium]|nr:OmpA family protein [Candidatus Anaeroferrophillus wilburensis]MBN2889182.1 OmpA family protein [Deltaproteobacteria bacterium]
MAEEQVQESECPEGNGEECEEGAPAWMATFADMATLLMTFFVLLLSFSNMDVVKFRTMLGSVKDAFGTTVESPGDFQERSSTPVSIQLSEEESHMIDMLQMGDQVKRAIEEHHLEDAAEVSVDERGVTLQITGQLMFDAGSATIKEELKPFLATITRIIEENTYPVAIEGHTDNLPMTSSPIYPSNWELSSARATAVLRHLVEVHHLPPNRLMAVGYADTRPLVPNDTPENRAKNRRVEFHFMKEAASSSPPAATQ